MLKNINSDKKLKKNFFNFNFRRSFLVTLYIFF